MPKDMPGTGKQRSVGRPAQGRNSELRSKPGWNPTPQAGPARVSIGSVSHPKAPPKWRPKPQPAPGRVNSTGPGV